MLNIQEEKLLNYVKSCGAVTRRDVEKYMGIKKTKATILLNELFKNKFIRKVGAGRGMKYIISGKN